MDISIIYLSLAFNRFVRISYVSKIHFSDNTLVGAWLCIYLENISVFIHKNCYYNLFNLLLYKILDYGRSQNVVCH